MTADKYIHGDLYALVPISLMSSPNGRFLRSINTGKYVGTIYSYIVNNGVVWWQLEDNQSGHLIGFVQHDAGKFDSQKLENSIIAWEAKRQAEIDEKVKERKDNNSMFSFLDDIEGLVSTIMIVIILLIVLNAVKK